MLSTIVKAVSGPLGVAATIAELVVMAGKVADVLSDNEEED